MIRTFLVVTVVAALVWIWAEDQTLRTEEVDLIVVMLPGSPGKLVRPVPNSGWTGLVSVRAQGSARQLSELMDRAQEPIELVVGRELPADPGSYDLLVDGLLRSHERFSHRGMSFLSVDPPRVPVQVDVPVQVEVPILVESPGVDLEGVPAIDPAVVMLQMPGRTADRLRQTDEPLDASIVITPEMVAGLVPGRAERLLGIPVNPPEGLRGAWAVEVVPARVSIELAVASRSDELVIPVLPVQIQVAPAELDRWKITIGAGDQDLRDIRLTGPSEVIEQIRQGEIEIVAAIRLDFEELERRITSKDAVLFGLPSGIAVDIVDRSVRLEITPRAASGPLGFGVPAGIPGSNPVGVEPSRDVAAAESAGRRAG